MFALAGKQACVCTQHDSPEPHSTPPPPRAPERTAHTGSIDSTPTHRFRQSRDLTVAAGVCCVVLYPRVKSLLLRWVTFLTGSSDDRAKTTQSQNFQEAGKLLNKINLLSYTFPSTDIFQIPRKPANIRLLCVQWECVNCIYTRVNWLHGRRGFYHLGSGNLREMTLVTDASFTMRLLLFSLLLQLFFRSIGDMMSVTYNTTDRPSCLQEVGLGLTGI